MSVQRFNRGQIPEALARFFGLKGDVNVNFQETLVPHVLVGDVVDSPYLLYAIGVMGGNAQPAAGAAELGAVGFRPGPNVALQMHQLSILNETGSSVTYSVRLLSAANVATLGVTGEANLVDVSGSMTRRSSSTFIGSHTSLLGDALLTVIIAAGESAIITLPRGGVVLNGSDRPALVGFSVTPNAAITVTAYGREWPLPG